MVYFKKSSSGHGHTGTHSGHTSSTNRLAVQAYPLGKGRENCASPQEEEKLSILVSSSPSPSDELAESTVNRVFIKRC